MKCPIDQTDLMMTERQGVEIDYCPKCRGVWLDRGELDKLIERSGAVDTSRREAGYAQETRPAHREERYEEPRYKDQGYRPKKRKSLLGEIFDF